jgi:CheY-like chemotaxis protein
VLVIDDSSLIRAAGGVAISRVDGWEPLLASCAEEGLACAAREQPDAILLDVVMPGIDGLETARRLQSDPATSRIPVVLLTAQERVDTPLAALGVAGLIRKPFDVATLAGELAALLGWTQ